MKTSRRPLIVPLLATAALVALGPPVLAQLVELVDVDVKAVGAGWRASELTGHTVVNEQNQDIGKIDDFVITRDDHDLYPVLEVGGFLGIGGHLVAVPFESLKFEETNGKVKIVLPGASKDALEKLPEFNYAS